MKKNGSPRSADTLPEAKNKKLSAVTNTTIAIALQAKGLRFAAARLAKSRIGLLGSLTEGREVLDLLKRHPDQDAAAAIGRTEQRLARTSARLEDVTNALAAVEVTLARLEGGV